MKDGKYHDSETIQCIETSSLVVMVLRMVTNNNLNMSSENYCQLYYRLYIWMITGHNNISQKLKRLYCLR